MSQTQNQDPLTQPTGAPAPGPAPDHKQKAAAMGRPMNRLSRAYRMAGDYVFDDLKYIIIGFSAGFVLVILAATLFYQNNFTAAIDMYQTFVKSTGDAVSDSGDILFSGILLNNIKATLIMTVLGFVPFLFLTAISFFSNALILGAMNAIIISQNISLTGMIVFGILPHGIFEIPAIIISMSMGFMICLSLTKRICEPSRNRGTVVPVLKKTGLAYVLIVIPLLIIAAVIESNLTPLLLDYFTTM